MTTSRSPAKRDAILRAATSVFLKEGYRGTSVDAIAAAAGVAKQTVYGHFGNKEQLFFAVVDRASADLEPSPSTIITDTGDPRADLEAAAVRMLRVITHPEHAALHRLTIAEAAHHPELQRGWRDDKSGHRLRDAIAGYLAACADRGILAVPDPDRTARQFLVLIGGEGQVRSLRGLDPLSEADLQEIAHDTVTLILAAHRPT